MRFAVHPPAQRRASPRSHGMPCRDVACRVHVGVAGVSAGPAAEDGLALARLGIHGPAYRARLARVRGIDSLDSADGLILQSTCQQAPAGSKNRSVEVGLGGHIAPGHGKTSPGRAGHVPDLQVLNSDHVESHGQAGGHLLGPVPARVGLSGPQPRHLDSDPDAALRAWLCAGQTALQSYEPLLPLLAGPRNLQQLSCGQSCGNSYATVNADYGTSARLRNRRWNHGECDVPPSRTVMSDPVGLSVPGDGTRPAELQSPCLRHQYFADMTAHPTDMLRLDRNDAEAFVPPGLPPRRSAMRTPEEVAHGLCEISQRLLLHHLGSASQPLILGASLGELAALCQVARRRSPAQPPMPVLLNSEIPDKPRVRAMHDQYWLLCPRRCQAIARHKSKVSATTDNSAGVKWIFMVISNMEFSDVQAL